MRHSPHYESSTIHKQFQPATSRRYRSMTRCNPVNRIALFFALTLSLPISAHADEASRRAKADEILTLLHMDRMSLQLMENILRQTTAITAQKSGGAMTPATQAALADNSNPTARRTLWIFSTMRSFGGRGWRECANLLRRGRRLIGTTFHYPSMRGVRPAMLYLPSSRAVTAVAIAAYAKAILCQSPSGGGEIGRRTSLRC